MVPFESEVHIRMFIEYSAKYGSTDIMKYLLNIYSNIGSPTNLSIAMENAYANNQHNILQILLDFGVDPINIDKYRHEWPDFVF